MQFSKIFCFFKKQKALTTTSTKSPQMMRPAHRAIWDMVSLSRTDFDRLYIDTLDIISQSDYFSSLDRTQKSEIFIHAIDAMKVRRGFVLPTNTRPEHLWKQSEMWTFAVFYSGLLSKYLQAYDAEKPFIAPLEWLSPVANKWLFANVKNAITANIYGVVGPLDPVFQKLYSVHNSRTTSTVVKRTPSPTAEEIGSISALHKTVVADISAPVEPPVISVDAQDGSSFFTLSVEQLMQANSLTLLSHKGRPVVENAHMDLINLISEKHTGLKYCELSNKETVSAVAFYRSEVKKLDQGYLLLGESYEGKKTRRVFLEQSLEEALNVDNYPIDAGDHTAISITRELVKRLALSEMEYSLGSPYSMFHLCEEGVCIDRNAWELIVKYVISKTLPSHDEAAPRNTWADKLQKLSSSPCIAAEKNDISKQHPCVFFVDHSYSKESFRATHFALTPPRPLTFNDLIVPLSQYAKKASKLGGYPPKAARTGGALFLPTGSTKYFFASHLGYYGEIDELLSFTEESNTPEHNFAKRAVCILKNKTIHGVLFRSTALSLPGELISVSEALTVDEIDFHFAREQLHLVFGDKPSIISKTNFKTFIVTKLKSASSPNRIAMELSSRSGVSLVYSEKDGTYDYRYNTF